MNGCDHDAASAAAAFSLLLNPGLAVTLVFVSASQQGVALGIF